jgi:DNA invertase Pin-like site-specific DNA recombinase
LEDERCRLKNLDFGKVEARFKTENRRGRIMAALMQKYKRGRKKHPK